MTAVMPWLERKFSFDLPAALCPNICARYRGTPARLEEAAAGLSHEQLIAKDGKQWSIQENAGHLLDEESLFQTRLSEYLAGAEKLTPAPYLHRELAHNQRDISEILREFRAARERQVGQLAGLSPAYFSRSAWHPRLKVQMRLVDHLLCVFEHDDHHLARIWELRSASPQAT